MSFSVAFNSIISNTLKHHESLLQQPEEGEEFGISDSEESEIAIDEDIDYQESHPTTMNSTTPVQPTVSFFQQYDIKLPQPPPRPTHFRCQPAWHLDEIASPITSDREEMAGSEDSEEGVVPESSTSGQIRRNQKRKARRERGSKEKQDKKYKRNKTEQVLNETQNVDVEEAANLHALIQRSRGRQPHNSLEFLPEWLSSDRTSFKSFTTQQV